MPRPSKEASSSPRPGKGRPLASTLEASSWLNLVRGAPPPTGLRRSLELGAVLHTSTLGRGVSTTLASSWGEAEPRVRGASSSSTSTWRGASSPLASSWGRGVLSPRLSEGHPPLG
ncbi:UNVERIFIED_CONTAM: hypothetical protein Sradi_6659600 [Sesamum radiatum]|uniref:REJ domain-containing protein n=1 Tax=Sesamum radiatum TaxID=300843 RepID=A0AAW2JNE8_SESRA